MITRVKLRKPSDYFDERNVQWVESEDGRIDALKVSIGTDHRLFVMANNNNDQLRNNYQSRTLVYFYSANAERYFFEKEDFMNANDDSYIRLSDGLPVDAIEARNENGDLKDGYIVESLYLESLLRNAVTSIQEASIRRKFNL